MTKRFLLVAWLPATHLASIKRNRISLIKLHTQSKDAYLLL